jgi:C-terminal peptidase prc
LALFNLDDKEKTYAVSLKDMGLAEGAYILTDVWSGEQYACEESYVTTVEAHGSRLLAVSRKKGVQLFDANIRINAAEFTERGFALQTDYAMNEAELLCSIVPKHLLYNGEELEFKMNRTKIENESVTYSELTPGSGIGYIKISSFIDDTAKDFKLAVRDLKNMGCDKFIIDLRNNGGGLTQASLDIADYLLPECMIMTEIDKDGSEKEYKSDKSAADLDMVVLVNENTASASEILTAAIKDNKAGTVIGTKTYGKGVTQMSHQFKDGYAIKLTITEYLTPNGDHVQEKGIEPDVKATDEDILDKALDELKD